MKKIFLLVFAFVMCKLGYAQYPMTQFIGTDSAIVVSKGAMQSRFVNVVFADTTTANSQRIKQYPGAMIYAAGKLWYRNATATGWVELTSTSTDTNIYNSDGTLTGPRTLNGNNDDLTFDNMAYFSVNANPSGQVRFYQGSNNNILMRGDTTAISRRLSYNTNLGSSFTKHSLIDKNYVDSSFSLNINGTTNYLPKFTSSSAIGNSAMYDSSGFIKLYKDFRGTPQALQNDYFASTINVDGRYGWGLLVQQNDSITNGAQIPLLLRKGLLTNDKPRPNYGTGLGMQLQDDSGAWRASSYFINRITDSTAAGFKTNMQLYLPNGSGFVVPFTAYADSSIRLPKLAGSGTRYVVANSSGDLGIGTDPVTGTGTTNYIPKFTSSSAIGNSIIYESSNLIGIGTAFPSYKLDAQNAGAIGVRSYNSLSSATANFIAHNNTGIADFGINATGGYIQTQSSIPFIFSTNNTERMRLDASGNLGLGTTTFPTFSNTTQLVVRGGTAPSIIQSVSNDKGSSITLYSGNNSSDNPVVIYQKDLRFASVTDDGLTGYAERMRIASNGNVGVGIVPTAYLGFVSSAAGISLHTNSTSGAAGLNFYENSSGRFSLRTLNGTAGLSFFDSFNGAERARIDASGNLGLGVTPSAWSNFRVIQGVGTSGNSAIAFNNSGGLDLVYNTFYNGTNFIYLTTGNLANRYTIEAGTYKWYTAPSGTAGNAITFTQAMTLDASGRLGLGVTNQSSYNAGGNHLVIGGGAFRGLTIAGTTEGNIYFADGTTGTETYRGSVGYNHTSDYLFFYSAANERMRITSGGNVLIGSTTDGGQKLQVTGSSIRFQNAGTFELDLFNSTANNFLRLSATATGGLIGTIQNVPLVFISNGSERMRLTSGGNLLVGTTSASTTGVYGTPQISVESDAFASSQIMSHNNTSGNFSILGIGKSRGTGAAPTIVADGEVVGAIYFFGYDGASYRPTSAITSIVNGTPGTADMPGALIFNTTADGASSISERARITSSGELLINTTSDAGDFKLQVSGNAYVSGSVGIGTSPSYKLDVAGTFRTQDNTYLVETGTGSVGINTNSVNASAILEIKSTAKGFLPPRMTNAQMVAIATPEAGLVVYDTTNNKLNVYDGTNWVTLH